MKHRLHKMPRVWKDRLQLMLEDWTGNAIGAALFCGGMVVWRAVFG